MYRDPRVNVTKPVLVVCLAYSLGAMVVRFALRRVLSHA